MSRFAAALLIVYALIALAVQGGAIDAEWSRARVGASDLPGLGRSLGREQRIAQALFRLDRTERALQSQAPRAALEEEFRFFARPSAKVSADLLGERVEAARDAALALDAFPDADRDPRSESAVALLERRVATLSEEPGGARRWRGAIATSLGTDAAGRSIALRALCSVAMAWKLGLVAALVALVLGALLGTAAGTFGGVLDHVLSAAATTLSALPALILLIVLAYALQGSQFAGGLLPVHLAFAATFWVGPFRVLRAQALRTRELDHVQAARALGFSPMRILLRHVLPAGLPLCFVQGALVFVAAVKAEVLLSYFGLGVQGQVSWGTMIRDAASRLPWRLSWELGAATLLLAGMVLALHAVADAAQERARGLQRPARAPTPSGKRPAKAPPGDGKALARHGEVLP